MKSKKKKRKFKTWIYSLILFFSISILAHNIDILVNWKVDSNQIQEEIQALEDKSDDVIDIAAFRRINPDTVGFLSVPGTDIHYPVVQTYNNEFYLDHSFRRRPNQAGWIFMDYRNNPDFSDKNTIIYGHDRIDDTMFGTLINVFNDNWLNNQDYHIIKYITDEEELLWQVFSVYWIPVETYYLHVDFTDNEFSNWLNTMTSRSRHNFNINLTTDDYILTLSTCKNDDNRIVVHAKLIDNN